MALPQIWQGSPCDFHQRLRVLLAWPLETRTLLLAMVAGPFALK